MELPENTLAILPRESRAKFERMIADRDAAHAVVRSTSDALQAARHDFLLLNGRVRAQLEGFCGYEVLPPGQAFRPGAAANARSETEERLMEPVRSAERRRDLAADAHERAVAAWERFAFVDECVRWIERMARLGAPRLEHFAPAAPRTKDPAAEIAKIRAELAGLDEAWTAAENAPAPASELKARFLAELDQIAANGAPSIAVTARAGSPINLAAALRIATQPVFGGDGSITTALSGDGGAAFFVWMMRDEIAERITAMIDAAVPKSGVLTDDQRDAEFSRINAERLRLERLEEACVVASEAQGQTIARRREADPRAILEVRET